MLGSVQAGFPSPAADYMEEGINLNRDLIRHPHATYFMRAKGESMTGAYIPPEAILVIDRLEKPKNGSIVVAVVNGEFTVKRLSLQQSKKHLLPENPKYAPIEINEFTQCELWGVVIHIIIDAKTV
ncbi:MAG: translesion error-prone DNA polymerase V autoproteolytic subunit [Flavisolibacter sp.]|nr:translesion error-prone DNA polymerase V autoproteolytic subunit [Flavisolibacter sp.]MBD0296808.1 translesion error-prone DNA polymerase V autoproteolytic subunit [Flavisolibacter sp.]MBD0368292.1 translesion error-prone DNA polymerase V autoproteolytic subunit [Flavisolibacter sp.]